MNSKQNPDHYQLGTIQVWDFIVDQDLDFLLGNVVKYVCRAGAKPGESREDDLRKAHAYITKALENVRTPEGSHHVPQTDGPASSRLRSIFLDHAGTAD